MGLPTDDEIRFDRWIEKFMQRCPDCGSLDAIAHPDYDEHALLQDRPCPLSDDGKVYDGLACYECMAELHTPSESFVPGSRKRQCADCIRDSILASLKATSDWYRDHPRYEGDEATS